MTREEIIEQLDSIIGTYEILMGNGVNSDILDVDDIEAIREAISALSENKGEWIPVSERLPDNNVRVLCSAISTSISGGYTRFVGCCNNGFWFVQTDAETVSYPRQYKVTAWMPLPSPWKGE